MNKADKNANHAFKWVLAPAITSVAGFLLVNLSEGWDSIGLFFLLLMITGLVCLIPITLAASALFMGTNYKEKALISIYLSVGIIIVYGGSLGGVGLFNW